MLGSEIVASRHPSKSRIPMTPSLKSHRRDFLREPDHPKTPRWQAGHCFLPLHDVRVLISFPYESHLFPRFSFHLHTDLIPVYARQTYAHIPFTKRPFRPKQEISNSPTAATAAVEGGLHSRAAVGYIASSCAAVDRVKDLEKSLATVRLHSRGQPPRGSWVCCQQPRGRRGCG
jgi:hypothetical protein